MLAWFNDVAGDMSFSSDSILERRHSWMRGTLETDHTGAWFRIIVLMLTLLHEIPFCNAKGSLGFYKSYGTKLFIP